MKTDELFQTIADRIVEQMEAGVRPWTRPWNEDRAGVDFSLPHNLTGRPYRGANAFWLYIIGKGQGYETPVWLTFNQAKKAGGNVKKGERGSPVFFWKFDVKPDPKTKEPKRVVWAKQYTVFNIDQCEGVKLPQRKARTKADRIAEAEALMEATEAKISYGGNVACFIPSLDRIQMPEREAFKAPEFFYGTAFHELGHWTGHESRLNRQFGKRFGDEAYAAEELVAELTAAFVMGTLGLSNPEREDHASYIANWIRMLKGDPKAFITAAGKAQAAADMILKAAEAADAEEED